MMKMLRDVNVEDRRYLRMQLHTGFKMLSHAQPTIKTSVLVDYKRRNVKKSVVGQRWTRRREAGSSVKVLCGFNAISVCVHLLLGHDHVLFQRFQCRSRL